jgi:hypothetical protein
MAQPEWKSIPWEEDPTSKQGVDFLMDILCDIAKYRAQLKTIITVKDKGMLGTDVLLTFQELNSWWDNWGITSALSCVETEADKQNSVMHDAEGPVLDTILQYRDIWTAHQTCTYNTARILILELLRSLLPPETLPSVLLEIPNPTPLLGRSSDTKALALEIIRSLDYTNALYENFMGTFCVALVLDVAYTSMEPSSRIRKWLWGGRDVTEEEKRMTEAKNPAVRPLLMLPTCQINRGRWLYLFLEGQVRQ